MLKTFSVFRFSRCCFASHLTGDMCEASGTKVELQRMSSADLPGMLPSMLPRLWRFALRLTRDRHDAEDLVQRACLRALERADQLQAGTAPLSWMFSIVHTTWINELQARNVRERSSVEWDDSRVQNVADQSVRTPEEGLMNRQVIDAVMRLPEAQRAVMLLVALEGLSYTEAAEVLNVPVGTVMSRLSRARQAIGAHFTPGRRSRKSVDSAQ